MIQVPRILLMLFLAAYSLRGVTYEIDTHGAITGHVYDQTVLSSGSLIEDLGLGENAGDIGDQYYDVSGSTVQSRSTFYSREGKIIKALGANALSIKGWLMRGAIREDDICSNLYPPFVLPSYCDGPIHEIRVFNHFFDPVYSRPLTVAFQELGDKATDWVTGASDAYANPPQENAARDNHFSWTDANEAMFRALTGHSTAGATDIGPGNTAATETVRKAYWATAFRALGDVLHIVQDMAQPQHTRNDRHNYDGKLNRTAYEGYINSRALGQKLTCFNQQQVASQGLNYGGYPAVTFDRFRSFISTNPGSQAGVVLGTGLADYSNRGFFTAGSNVGNTDYTSPPTTNIDYNYQQDIKPYGNGCLPGEYAFVPTVVYRRAVADTYNFSYNAQNVALTAEGIWTKKFLGTLSYKGKGYGLARVNYDEMADLLIPRAVAYGAGVIDYFFRGRIKVLDVREDVTTGGTPAYRVTVKNVSEYPVSTATVFSTGDFSFYYKALDGSSNSIMQKLDVLEGDNPQLTTSDAFAPDDTLTFLLRIPDPGAQPADPVWDHTRPPSMVAVFNGQIGLEPGIAAYVFSPGGLIAVEHVQDTNGRAVARTFLSEDNSDHWSIPFQDRPGDGGANNYHISHAGYLGASRLEGFGYTNPVGTGTYDPTWFSSDDLGRSWTTRPSTAPGKQGLATGYAFQHIEFVSGSTLATLRVPAGATQTGNKFYSDYEVYLSTDAGQSWSVAGALSNIYYPSGIIFTGMNGATPTFALLAAYQDPVEGMSVGFYRSTDGGQNWVRENDNVFSYSIAHDGSGYSGPDAYYHLAWLGNGTYLMNYVRSVPNGQGGSAEFHNEVYRSIDNGNTWTSIGELPEPNDDGDPLTIGEVLALQYLGGDRVFVYMTRLQHANAYPWYTGYTASGVSVNNTLTWTPFSPGLPLDVNTSVTPNYHTNVYSPFTGALDNGAIPGQYDAP